MVIRRIGVWSAARLYGGICAAMGLLIGAIFALASMAGGLAWGLGGSQGGLSSGGLGMLFGAGAIIVLPIFYGVLGIIGGAIGAALDNLFAGMFGGIELETEP